MFSAARHSLNHTMPSIKSGLGREASAAMSLFSVCSEPTFAIFLPRQDLGPSRKSATGQNDRRPVPLCTHPAAQHQPRPLCSPKGAPSPVSSSPRRFGCCSADCGAFPETNLSHKVSQGGKGEWHCQSSVCQEHTGTSISSAPHPEFLLLGWSHQDFHQLGPTPSTLGPVTHQTLSAQPQPSTGRTGHCPSAGRTMFP